MANFGVRQFNGQRIQGGGVPGIANRPVVPKLQSSPAAKVPQPPKAPTSVAPSGIRRLALALRALHSSALSNR